MDGMNRDGMNRRDFAGLVAGLLAVAGGLSAKAEGQAAGTAAGAGAGQGSGGCGGGAAGGRDAGAGVGRLQADSGAGDAGRARVSLVFDRDAEGGEHPPGDA